jgi:hypothetical protein
MPLSLRRSISHRRPSVSSVSQRIVALVLLIIPIFGFGFGGFRCSGVLLGSFGILSAFVISSFGMNRDFYGIHWDGSLNRRGTTESSFDGMGGGQSTG